MNQHKSLGIEQPVSEATSLPKETPMQRLWKVLVMVGVGLGGSVPAFGASHGGHHGNGHAGAAHRGHSGGSHSGGRASAAYRGHSGGYHRGRTAHDDPHGGSDAQRTGPRASPGNSYATKGRPFRGGYYYPCRNHQHWAYTVFDNRYGCTLYYDAELGSYYYWCQPDDCYYPVSYCPYDQYVWSTVVNDQPSGDKDPHRDDARQLRTILDDLKAMLR